ncbi:MAG: glycosyltransferase family 4 protein, partial [Actinomycetota bacterium]|nr:glycosyltransferase family 4 protein [Actinomycetota bacterium]
GLGGAATVVGGSNYMIRAAGAVVGGWQNRAVVVNPGCDIDLFAPVKKDADAVPTVGFIGKLLAAKGTHLFLAALGKTTASGLRAVVVGDGSFGSPLHELTRALRSGDRDGALEVATRGDGDPLDDLVAFLSSRSADEDYFRRLAEVAVEFTGHLEHRPLARLLPTLDVLVVPSVVPEAFGMVAAEAAACGVLPVVPDHSGIAEAGRAVEDALGMPGLLVYDPGDPIAGIAAAVDRILARPAEDRQRMGQAAAALARERWSWEQVSDRLLQLALRGAGPR